MSQLVPVVVHQTELVAILREMADLVEAYDSFDGSIEFSIPIEADFGEFSNPYEVRAVYRHGNRDHGQGFVRTVGQMRGVSP